MSTSIAMLAARLTMVFSGDDARKYGRAERASSTGKDSFTCRS
jgi:hypothetical protein